MFFAVDMNFCQINPLKSFQHHFCRRTGCSAFGIASVNTGQLFTFIVERFAHPEFQQAKNTQADTQEPDQPFDCNLTQR